MAMAYDTLVFTQEWIDGNNFQRLPQEDQVDLSFAQELYDACIGFFTKVLQGISRSGSDIVQKYQLGTLKEEWARLYLWGSGFENGKLAGVLAQSDELRDSVLELLSGTSQLLIHNCLMDLLPTMEQSLAQSRAIRKAPALRIPFTVSEAARPFVLNVHDKFSMADSKLVERLGESNWQRYVTVRARMNRIASVNDVNGETREVEWTKPVVFGKNPPQSMFTPYSVFHDSGMGTSMASTSRYTASVASHTSFISSQAEEGKATLRVPPTPPEVALNEPFRCFICGHMLFKIQNRVDWKWVNLEKPSNRG
ncbi:MAG: hypothetical protein Q9187_001482 [Circinaria calcarea]